MGNSNTETVLLETAERFGMNLVREIPEEDLNDPGVVELPAALVQKLEWAQAAVADTEGAILAWMTNRRVRPELCESLLEGYERAREVRENVG